MLRMMPPQRRLEPENRLVCESRVNDANSVTANRTRSRRRRYLAGIAVLCGGIAWGAALYLESWPDRLCRQLEAELASADAEQIPELVQRLKACGPRALPALTGLLGSPRAEVADAAEAALCDRIHLFRSGQDVDWHEAESMALELSRAAAALSKGERGRHVATTLELLEAAGHAALTEQSVGDVRGRILSTCEELLRSEPSARPTAVLFDDPPVGGAGASAAASGSLRPSAPMPPVPTQETDIATSQSQPVGTASIGPQNAVPSGPDLSPAANTGHASAPGAANSGARVGDDASSNVVRAAFSRPIETLGASNSGSPTMSSAAKSDALPSRRSAWILFDELTSADAQLADQARRELERRGFRPDEIELGRRFADADGPRRRLLLESLPSQPGLDLRPWLLHFATDDDPQVRLAAITIMATTRDPQLLDRVKQSVFADADEEVRRTARRLLEGR